MARTWIVDGKGIASKVKNASQLLKYQVEDCGAIRECPNCHHCIDNSDVSLEWAGLPAGVKFNPSDEELVEHLAGKAGVGNSKPHVLIDEFIPTLEGNEGICYTHPENLPGARKDGSSIHFFHRTSRAYATGHRKRRRIHGQDSLTTEHVRWHKTGKTKPVTENGIHKGWKKIMVLYKSSKKGSKPDRSKWVMYQYHLGTKEDEDEGEFVVSKIFYKQESKQTDKSSMDHAIDESVMVASGAGPSSPKTYTPNPSRPGKRALLNEAEDENIHDSPPQDAELISEECQPPHAADHLKEKKGDPLWWAGKSQAFEDPDPNGLDALLLCNEILDAPINESDPHFLDFGRNGSDMLQGDINIAHGTSDLDNLEPLDFQLADLQFGSQESITSWIERL